MNELATTNTNILLQTPTDHLTLDEYYQLQKAIDAKYKKLPPSVNNQFLRDRNHLLLTTLWTTGARISDVLSFQTNTINYDNRTLTFFVKKRRKMHTISINAEYALQFNQFVHKYSLQKEVFVNLGSMKPMARSNVNSLLEELCTIARIRHINPHLFRHGIATYMLAQGVSLDLIAYRLCHSSVLTTAKYYARITPEIERGLLPDMNANEWTE